MESSYCAGCKYYDPVKMYCHYYLAGIECVKRCPISDVVPVVRCKYCKYWNTDWTPIIISDSNIHLCDKTEMVTDGEFFCACGERKDDE